MKGGGIETKNCISEILPELWDQRDHLCLTHHILLVAKKGGVIHRYFLLIMMYDITGKAQVLAVINLPFL